MHMCTRTYTRKAHTHTHTSMRKYMQTYIHTFTHAHTHTNAHTHTHTHTHTHIYIYILCCLINLLWFRGKPSFKYWSPLYFFIIFPAITISVCTLYGTPWESRILAMYTYASSYMLCRHNVCHVCTTYHLRIYACIRIVTVLVTCHTTCTRKDCCHTQGIS